MKAYIVNIDTKNGKTGIITKPDKFNTDLPFVIFLNAGIINNVGPNRSYVRMARNIVNQGFASFRFDYSELNSHEGSINELSYDENQINDVQKIITFLETTEGISIGKRMVGLIHPTYMLNIYS